MSFRAANLMQVACNWLLGWRIVEQEQHGKARADYGKHVIETASENLTAEFGKGFSVASLKSYREFYLNFQVFHSLPEEFKKAIAAKGQALPALFESEEIRQALPTQLSWSYYECLMRVTDIDARTWYMQEVASQQWDYRTLKRNIASQYYYRLMQTPKAKKATVVKEMKKLTADYQKERSEYIKNPLIAEFLGVNQGTAVTESTLESAILNHLQNSLLRH